MFLTTLTALVIVSCTTALLIGVHVLRCFHCVWLFLCV